MGKIVFDAAVTLNGFLADENHSLQWLFEIDGGDDPDPDLLPSEVKVNVEGANTYLWVLEHENFMEDPSKWQTYYGDQITYVFTHRDLPIPDGADVRLVQGTVEQHLTEIREAAAGGNIWVLGGGELLGQFLDIDALDELALTIAPATVASGAPILPRAIGSDRLKLVEARHSGPFARLRYEVLKQN
ncbi:dihydrofolate reductase family protein [Glutamicibacter sp. NPDC087344]|uniref:dihydrofolate reductase family protein n=1 Tax=Glutamicibacter sp. NPDC087344 TaxID=3363994 RepID=UPI0038043B29